jgi:hypothetical protein
MGDDSSVEGHVGLETSKSRTILEGVDGIPRGELTAESYRSPTGITARGKARRSSFVGIPFPWMSGNGVRASMAQSLQNYDVQSIHGLATADYENLTSRSVCREVAT